MQEHAEGHRWMLRLDPGEELLTSLATFARDRSVRAGAVLLGIGMLQSARLGYWNGREYVPRTVTEPHELLSANGSLAVVDGSPSVHLHVVLGAPDHSTVGGHLLEGTVGVLAELYVASFPGATFGRPLDESFGLRRLDLLPGPHPPV